mmetsp:Transcript_6699/g.16356  ORF Transcript_6699/g.16356 Transcript_6699/m.16356 type:complete len:81 (-) Transcript_6699:2568-2810(-)
MGHQRIGPSSFEVRSKLYTNETFVNSKVNRIDKSRLMPEVSKFETATARPQWQYYAGSSLYKEYTTHTTVMKRVLLTISS